ncbi:MAG: hypothetical protein IKD00_01950 [Candidatus Methanomethylophilaceae archaeon]|nr:hypothetical protein [Candidatus Methanomethylophilaceae archaeon]
MYVIPSFTWRSESQRTKGSPTIFPNLFLYLFKDVCLLPLDDFTSTGWILPFLLMMKSTSMDS